MDRLKQFAIAAGFIAAVLLAVPSTYVILLSFLNIVSPALVRESSILQLLAMASAAIALGVPASWIFFFKRIRSIPDDALPSTAEARPWTPMVRNLRIRSRWFKLAAALVLGIMLCIAVVGFTIAMDVALQERAQSSQTLTQPTAAMREQAEQTRSGESLERVLSQEIGALVLLVLVLRTLGLVYRSNMRLASFYDARADYLQLGGNPEKLTHEELLELVTAKEREPAWTRVFRGSSQRQRNGTSRRAEGGQRAGE